MTKLQPYELFNKHSQTFFFNLKVKPIQLMLDFDYLSQRKTPSIAAIIHPGRSGYHKAHFGLKEILIPIYSSIKEATTYHPTPHSLINFASFRSAYQSSLEALNTPQIKIITIAAEGIPERLTKKLIATAKEQNKAIIGPATVGGIVAGKFRIAHTGGLNENIIRAKLYRPGSVGLVSRSGGMMNEFYNIISRATDGIYEGFAIGGDQFPGSTLLEHMLRFEKNPIIKLIVSLGEIGGTAEYDIAQAIRDKRITKPVVMWVSGTCASIFPYQVQFGHAGAKASSENEAAQAKNQALKSAGAIIPINFENFEPTLKATYQSLIEQNIIIPKPEPPVPKIPSFQNELQKEHAMRTTTSITSSISSDKPEIPTYNSIPITQFIKRNSSLGTVIGHLWFKKELPSSFTRFIDMVFILTADHGPAVATAHNAIVTSRAGKDVISSLIAGLTTIGDRHGGAIDAASRYFHNAVEQSQSPNEFVKEMKQKQIEIPGIGHRIKSKSNPDKRVEVLINYTKQTLRETPYLNFAQEVEKIMLEKAENLILNVDGAVGAIFLDMLHQSNIFSQNEIKKILQIGYLNGLFALARSVGMIGHALDQKRLAQPLYRHDRQDILYHEEEF